MEDSVTIRRVALGDAESILVIQSLCPELAPWSKRDYELLEHGGVVGWVASRGRGARSAAGANGAAIAGFITARIASDEFEILNFGVVPEERRTGIGKALLKTALAWGAANHARRAFLEVRASNRVAIQFYERFGFETVGRRPKYYSGPVEDALRLSAAIG